MRFVKMAALGAVGLALASLASSGGVLLLAGQQVDPFDIFEVPGYDD